MKNNLNGFLAGIFSLAGLLFISKTVSFSNEKLTSLASKTTKTLPKVSNDSITAKLNPKTADANLSLAEKVIGFGLSKIGRPYRPGGITEAGFDCSGFVHYVFDNFNINVPHSSKLLADFGRKVEFTQAQKGDILIFTGTKVSDRSPGHVGIIISKPGEPISFVHSSSNGGVKISQVQGTNYERRFLEIRRVL